MAVRGGCLQRPAPVAGPQALQAHGAVIWALAFAPVLGMAAEAMVGTAVHGSLSGAERALAHPFSLWMCVLLNIALSTWDERRLRQAGIETSAFGPAFLVPVYLFKRARMLGHRPPAYLIGWLVCWGLVLAL